MGMEGVALSVMGVGAAASISSDLPAPVPVLDEDDLLSVLVLCSAEAVSCVSPAVPLAPLDSALAMVEVVVGTLTIEADGADPNPDADSLFFSSVLVLDAAVSVDAPAVFSTGTTSATGTTGATGTAGTEGVLTSSVLAVSDLATFDWLLLLLLLAASSGSAERIMVLVRFRCECVWLEVLLLTVLLRLAAGAALITRHDKSRTVAVHVRKVQAVCMIDKDGR